MLGARGRPTARRWAASGHSRKESGHAGDDGGALAWNQATDDSVEHRARRAARAEGPGWLGARDELATVGARDRTGLSARIALRPPRRHGTMAPSRYVTIAARQVAR